MHVINRAILPFVACSVVGLLVGFGGVPVQAITTTPQPDNATAAARTEPMPITASAASDSAVVESELGIFSQPIASEDNQPMLDLFQAQVEDYKKKEREFSLAKAQSDQLQTLQAVEQAVQATKAVMLARTKVIITHLELVRFALNSRTGIDLPLKAALQARLDQRVEELRRHQQTVSTSDSRQAVAARADQFAQLARPIQGESRLAQDAITLGKVQTLVDKINILYTDVKEHYKTNPGSAVASAQRSRAYEQVDVIQQSLEIQLEAIRANLVLQLNPEPGRRPEGSSALSLNQPYALTSQYLEYLRELIMGEE